MDDALFSALAEVVADILEIDATRVTRDLNAEAVDSWDSLNHLKLITAVEDRFKVRLPMADIMSMENLGDLADSIARLGAQP